MNNLLLGSFRYNRLDTTSSNGAIRLLRVLPSEKNTPLTCEVIHTTTDKDYVALSYVWGPVELRNLIHIRTRNSHGYIYVRKQLYEFLLQMQRKNNQSWFWIDALCINQEDIEERNQQVTQMARIYRSANLVFVWLGCDRSLTELLGIFANHSFKIEKAQRKTKLSLTNIFRRSSKAFHPEPNPGPGPDPSLADTLRRSVAYDSVKWTVKHPGMTKLYTNTYWTRLWIRQELALGTDVLFLSGSSSVPLMTLNAVRMLVFLNREEVPHIWRDNSVMTEVFNCRTYAQDSRSPQERKKIYKVTSFDLYWRSNTECSEVRDRLFGILSLVDEGSSFRVDYAEDLYHLCCRAAQHFDMSQRRFYEMLEAMEIDQALIQTQAFENRLPDQKIISLRCGHGVPICTDDSASIDLKPGSEPILPLWMKAWLKEYGQDPDIDPDTGKVRTLILLNSWKPLLFGDVKVRDHHLICNEVWWMWPQEDEDEDDAIAIQFTPSFDVDAPPHMHQHLEIKIPLSEYENQSFMANTGDNAAEVMKRLIEMRKGQKFTLGWFSVEMSHWTLARSVTIPPGGSPTAEGVSQAPPAPLWHA